MYLDTFIFLRTATVLHNGARAYLVNVALDPKGNKVVLLSYNRDLARRFSSSSKARLCEELLIKLREHYVFI